MKYTPAFEFQGTRFVVASTDWLADSKEEADKIGIGGMFVEGILFGFTYCKENPIQEIPENDTEGRLFADSATLKSEALGELPIYLNIRNQ